MKTVNGLRLLWHASALTVLSPCPIRRLVVGPQKLSGYHDTYAIVLLGNPSSTLADKNVLRPAYTCKQTDLFNIINATVRARDLPTEHGYRKKTLPSHLLLAAAAIHEHV